MIPPSITWPYGGSALPELVRGAELRFLDTPLLARSAPYKVFRIIAKS